MISQITIKDVTSYDNTGAIINTDKKINYFFGYNGSGKSTIAKYLHDITLPITEHNSDFDHCSQTGYNPATQTILVYNDDFRDENFITKDEQKGIFSLNRTNATIDGQIQRVNDNIKLLQGILDKAKERTTRLETLKSQKEQHLQELVFAKRSAFSDCKLVQIPYGSSKKAFLVHLRDYLNPTTSVKSLTELLDEYKRIFANGLKNIPYDIDIPVCEGLVQQENAINALLDEVIVGNKDVDIAALIDQLQISSWVEQGIPYMEKSGDKCPFCQQKYEDKDVLKHKFEQFFDQTYKAKIEDLRTKGMAYYNPLDQLVNTLNEIAKLFNPENKVSSLSGELLALRDTFVNTINEKKAKPNEKKRIASLSSFLDRIKEVKSLVSKNNTDATNIVNLQKQWIIDAQVYLGDTSRQEIERFDVWNESAKHVLNHNGFTISSIEGRISYQMSVADKLRQQTVNTSDAVTSINKILRNVGFNGFEIKEKSVSAGTSATPSYYIKRQGSTSSKVYKSLSEGEKTFISFLYFYQLCLGTDDLAHGASKKKIIVIDDPVSSLDSKILFVITTLIHHLARYKGADNRLERAEFANPNIEQMFIFTHNFYFYKEVSFNRRPVNKNVVHHVIEKVAGISKITKSGDNSTIKNDYSLMWDHLKTAKATLGTDTSQNILIANTMRRIIDSYFDFIGMKANGSTITWNAVNSFAEGSPEHTVASSFISFINDESHGVAVLDDVYYTSISNQNPSVVFSAFKAIFKDIGRDHYEYMMEEEYED